MKCSEVRSKIVAAVEAITPDNVQYSGDRFSHVAPGVEILGYDRQFQLQRDTPQGFSGVMFGSADTLEVTFSLSVVYINTGAADFETRILDDGDAIVKALKVIEQVNDQILTLKAQGANDLETDDQGNRLIEWSLVVTYDPREG
tara:strand:- start:142 stop:573 length:432 start_codon:yes stop_codon:yes gene_type:complete